MELHTILTLSRPVGTLYTVEYPINIMDAKIVGSPNNGKCVISVPTQVVEVSTIQDGRFYETCAYRMGEGKEHLERAPNRRIEGFLSGQRRVSIFIDPTISREEAPEAHELLVTRIMKHLKEHGPEILIKSIVGEPMEFY